MVADYIKAAFSQPHAPSSGQRLPTRLWEVEDLQPQPVDSEDLAAAAEMNEAAPTTKSQTLQKRRYEGPEELTKCRVQGVGMLQSIVYVLLSPPKTTTADTVSSVDQHNSWSFPIITGISRKT